MGNTTSVGDGLTGYFLEDLETGMTASFTKTVTEADIILFSGVSGDLNPLHINEDYARDTMFKGRIAHGILVTGLISAVLGTRLPGPGCIYVSQSVKFLAPVKPGDSVTARATVSDIAAEKKRVTLKTECLVGDKLVVDGEAVVMVPKRG